MKLIDTWHLPIKTVSEQNMQREHWSVKAKRHKTQKLHVLLHWQEMGMFYQSLFSLPIHLELIRLSPRPLDHDNLAYSMKWVLDSICECFRPGLAPGQADNTKEITVSYKQQKGKPQAVIINFYKQD